ncbi:MAG: hypothetical protein IJ870_04340 [Alphaproteobacteria bacterium]|nr:hypothetical protein [Alphaproteobacteria bacterium]
MKRYPLYEKAINLLYREFEENFKVVSGSDYHEAYMREKIRHSMQVGGAGNGILAHEPYFQGKEEWFVETARVAILLHDIYRFRGFAVGLKQAPKLTMVKRARNCFLKQRILTTF